MALEKENPPGVKKVEKALLTFENRFNFGKKEQIKEDTTE